MRINLPLCFLTSALFLFSGCGVGFGVQTTVLQNKTDQTQADQDDEDRNDDRQVSPQEFYDDMLDPSVEGDSE